MWQRIQTVYLIFVILALLAMLFLPLWIKEVTASSFTITALYANISDNGMDLIEYFPYTFISIAIVLAILITIFEILQYKNRLTQMKLGALNSLMMSVVLGLSLYFIYSTDNSWNPEVPGSYQIGAFMPAFALVFNMLANRNIRKDEKLVRSVDRIR